MQKFMVKRTVDAFVIYEAEVEAESAEQAVELAERDEDKYQWGEGDVATFDAWSFVALDDNGDELEETARGDFMT